MDLLQELSEAQRIRCQEGDLFWEGSIDDYLEIVKKRPCVTENAFQRFYRMIKFFGEKEKCAGKDERVVVYNIFEDPIDKGADAVFGLDRCLMELVNTIKSAASGHGPQHRIILLHGPVGSAKSTIVRLLKKGLEKFTATPEGAVYTFGWKKEVLGAQLAKLENEDYVLCPLHENPLHLIPLESRETFIAKIMAEMDPAIRTDFGGDIVIEGGLCPFCREIFRELIGGKYQGDFAKLIRENVKVRRFVFSEQDRIGIGTFQPKDEKDQDSTELTGDINYRKITIVGRESAKAFNFDGEFEVGNRGLVEFIEMLKLDVAFLYDLLGVASEHSIKPKKFPEMHIDLVIIGHTNEPEYRKLQSNEFMEALRDRTIKIDFPYNTKLSEEIRIYEKDFNSATVKGRHLAPHTLEMASLWAVLTRLADPDKPNIGLIQKLKLYDGKSLPGFTAESVKELREAAPREGMSGVSPRYVQDKLSNVLACRLEECVNPFMVMKELESGLAGSTLITSDDLRKKYAQLMEVARGEYENMVKSEVQEAISADPEALAKLFGNYIDNVKFYTQKEKVKNRYTGKQENPDERLMRSVEEKMDIPESRKDDYRREIMNYIGARALEGKAFDYQTNQRLLDALKRKLFEDSKDTINLGQYVSDTMEEKTQKQIESVKGRLIKHYGYCEHCADDVLLYVASILARGDVKEEKKK